MSWKKTDVILGKQFTRRGLSGAIAAGMVCREAEHLYPGLFRAVSVHNATLTVAAPLEHKIEIKLIEGALIDKLTQYARAHQLPGVTRVRFQVETTRET